MHQNAVRSEHISEGHSVIPTVPIRKVSEMLQGHQMVPPGACCPARLAQFQMAVARLFRIQTGMYSPCMSPGMPANWITITMRSYSLF